MEGLLTTNINILFSTAPVVLLAERHSPWALLAEELNAGVARQKHCFPHVLK